MFKVSSQEIGHSSTERRIMQQVHDSDSLGSKVRSALYTNLLLLGFDPDHEFKKSGVKIDKETFKVPNHKAFQVVSRFLILLYDSSKEIEFKDCWPINGKKEEREFRSVCYKCVRSIVETNANCNFPNFTPSLFLSPGGILFCHLYLAFSRYVMQKIIARDYPDAILLPPPRTELEVDVMRTNTIVKMEKYKTDRQAIDNITVTFNECYSKQCDRYWKTQGEIRTLENSLSKLVSAETGAGSGDEHYDKVDNMLENLLDLKAEDEGKWQRIGELCEQIAKCKETVDRALTRPEDALALDGKDFTVFADRCVQLHSLLGSAQEAVKTFRERLSHFRAKSCHLPNFDLKVTDPIVDADEFLQKLREKLDVILDLERQTHACSHEGGDCKLVRPTPDFPSFDLKLCD